ncbi:hypothetical protein BCV70DRAFT_207004 [Testicularia cyperi]|uniref:Uncharacterized protein n=1 Tax=Testicularia cyperi TaxID=1882483 RepID=A0A317XPU1_9BASI|nr:hypothetical protein BCV70DRAFT_207004 [Testicularia cyperi]
MGGKDSGLASARASREATASSFATMPRHTGTEGSVPFYRQFLPTQLSTIAPNDPIPSLDELSALVKYLARVKHESSARLSRLESRGSDSLKSVFLPSANDLFCPPNLSSSSHTLYSDTSRQTSASSSSLASKQQRSRDRTFNLGSPAPSGSSQLHSGSPPAGARQKLKVKKERDYDGGLDGRASKEAVGGKAGPRSKTGRGTHGFDVADDESVASTDPDWDLDEDSIPSRPGRTYAKHKKRKRKDAGYESQEDESGSEFETSAILGGSQSSRPSSGVGGGAAAARASGAAATAAGAGSRRGSEVGLASSGSSAKVSSFGMRLKVNAGATPSGQTTPGLQRKASDATQMSTRRNSTLPSPSPHPSTPLALSTKATVAVAPIIYQPAPGWELPSRTPQSFVPVLEKSRLPRQYPTKPQEVNENFADKDWKERERERDRLLERESVGPGTPGVGPIPGQSMVKEATTGRRGGRDMQQTPIHTFYNYADAFFKTLTEDDLAWLSSKSDDHEPFQMPSLGRHYREVWDEEDALLVSGAIDAYGIPLATHSRTPSISMAPGAGLPLDASIMAARNGAKAGSEAGSVPRPELELAPPPHFKPTQMTDQHLGFESPAVVDARSGPLAERLVAAILPTIKVNGEVPHRDSVANFEHFHIGSGDGVNGLHAGLLGGPSLDAPTMMDDDETGGDDDAEGEPDLELEGLMQDQDMVGFEERIRKELKALDVLGAEEDVDWSTRADDEISTTLRMVQRELATQQKVNEMRKARLFQIAKDRMAYQDYLACLHTVEKEIESGWTKRLRQIKASLGKRKKGGHSHASAVVHHEDGGANGINSATGTPQPGVQPYNGPVRPQLPENLVTAMDRREKLQFAFRDLFEESKHAWQTPTESIYADLPLEDVDCGHKSNRMVSSTSLATRTVVVQQAAPLNGLRELVVSTCTRKFTYLHKPSAYDEPRELYWLFSLSLPLVEFNRQGLGQKTSCITGLPDPSLMLYCEVQPDWEEINKPGENQAGLCENREEG